MYKKIDIHELSLNPFDEIGQNWILITAKKGNHVNTMTASWGALGRMWNKDSATVYIRPQRYTKEFIDQAELFTITFFDGYKKELGVLGSRSGRDSDKIKDVGFDIEFVDQQPTFKQGKLVLVCKKMYRDVIKPECFVDQDLDQQWYPQKDYHDMYIVEIISAYRNV